MLLRSIGGAAGLQMDLRRDRDITLVSLQGEISERFNGTDLGRRLRGTVIIDLPQIERITSFGVREWLKMLEELYADQLVLARCSESFIHQVSMIRSFCGSGRIASFFTPYACEVCGTEFSVLYDAIVDRAAIERREPVEASCPRCHAAARFDDDPQIYLSLEHHLLQELDPALALALERLRNLKGSPIRKAVVGQETWVTFNTKLDNNVRMRRVLEGLEGHVVFDLSAVPGATHEGLERFLQAVTGLGPEVKEIQLVGCPFELVEQILDTRQPRRGDLRLSIGSIRTLAACDAIRRMVVVDLRVPAVEVALRRGESPPVSCDWCEGELDFGPRLSVLQRALRLAPIASRGSRSSPSDPTTIYSSMPPPPSRVRQQRATLAPPPYQGSYGSPGASYGGPVRAPRTSATLIPPAPSQPIQPGPLKSALSPLLLVAAALAVGSLVGATGLLGGAIIVATEQGSLQIEGSAAGMGEWEGDLPPSWADQPFTYTVDGIQLVGAAAAPTPEEGLRLARRDMMRIYLKHLGDRVAAKGGFQLELPNAEALTVSELATAIGAYQLASSNLSVPERSGGTVRREGEGVYVIARYLLSSSDWARAIDHYTSTHEFRGITVGPTFPTLAPTLGGAEVVVVATQPWLHAARPGDVVRAVDGIPIASMEEYLEVLEARWGKTRRGRWMPLQLLRGEQPAEVEFRKP